VVIKPGFNLRVEVAKDRPTQIAAGRCDDVKRLVATPRERM